MDLNIAAGSCSDHIIFDDRVGRRVNSMSIEAARGRVSSVANDDIAHNLIVLM